MKRLGTAERCWRAWRAFWSMPGSRFFGWLLLAFVVVIVFSVWLLSTHYTNPTDGKGIRTAEAAYAVYTMLTFEAVLNLPRQWYTATVFFVVPLMGLLVLGQGLVRLGRALFDRDAWEVAMASTYHDHIIVCGLGKVGYRATRWLMQLGEPVVGVELNPDKRFLARLRSYKVPLVIADARETRTLEKAGVATASCIVPCVEEDLVNLAIALEARRLNPEIRVVLRLFDDRLADSMQYSFELQAAFSTSALSAPAFAAAAAHAPVDYAFSFGDEEVAGSALLTISDLTLDPDSPLVGYTLDQLEKEYRVAVLMHRRANRDANGDAHPEKKPEQQIHPPSDVELGPGDGFVVSAEIDALSRLAAHTTPTRELLQRQRRAELCPPE